SKTLGAPCTQLSQRHGPADAPGYVLDALDLPIRRLHLLPGKPRHVSGMQAVAYLMSASVKTDVSQGLPSQIRVNPEGKNSLVRSPELTGACKHSTTIDPDRQAKGLTIFDGKQLRREFGRSVKREWRGGVEKSVPPPDKPATEQRSICGR